MPDPRELGEQYAIIEPSNLLAHTIRKIEDRIFEVLKQKGIGLHYRINVFIDNEASRASVIFRKRKLHNLPIAN